MIHLGRDRASRNSEWYNSSGISITFIFINIVGIGFKLSPALSHQWTPDIYERLQLV
ncbi:hypothetical protein NC651_033285 [Populus alba x Populus x berolinensis]|nr:hypothetical protein NC651_033285 [Populus alba x Populus x berolinensis]